jgi:thiol-disulfide isomerase/thioredoxin
MLRIAVCAMLMLALSALAAPALAQSAWQRQAASRPGEAAPEQKQHNPAWDKYAFELPVIGSSEKRTFEELASDGQATVIFFWLADCPLCHLQMPYVEQLKQLADEHGLPVRVVGINVDQREGDAEDYIAEKQPTFEMLFDGNARRTGTPFSVDDLGCPLVYVFDSDGEFVDYISGFKSNLSKTVLGLLNLKVPDGK